MPPSAASLRYQSAISYTLRHAPSAPANETSLASSLLARPLSSCPLASTTSRHEEVEQQRPCHRRPGHLQGVRDRGGVVQGSVLQEGQRRRSPCCLVDAAQPLCVFRLQAQQQGSGDPLGEQAGQKGARLQGARDPGAEAVGDGEGEAEPGRADPAGRRRRARVPAGLLRRQGRAASEGAAVLPLHHGRAHRRDALRLHQEGGLPQRPPHHRHLPEGRRHGAGHLQGGGPAPEDRQGAAHRERRPAGGEVHPRRHRRRLRVLVHGLRQLPAVVQVHAAGRLGAEAAMTAPAVWGRPAGWLMRRSGRSGG